jgi:hypothetical protein
MSSRKRLFPGALDKFLFKPEKGAVREVSGAGDNMFAKKDKL